MTSRTKSPDDADDSRTSGDIFDDAPTSAPSRGLANRPAPRPRRALTSKPVPPAAFKNPQLDLFQNFLANTDEQRDSLSNAIELWDSIPRYSISRVKQSELRSPEGMLPIRKLDFNYRGKTYTAQIRPARIEVRSEDGTPTGATIEFYPSAREELIELALRKLAADERTGFFDRPGYRSGVSFSLHQLRSELRARGHSMTYGDLVEGLDIMNLANLRLIDPDTDPRDPSLASQPFLPSLVKVARKELERNPDARWVVEFHGALTNGIDRMAYRQYNYDRVMNCRSQLARWLINQLVLKYVQASPFNSFKMLYSTIRRDSALLDGYAQTKRAVEALDAAWDEVKKEGVLLMVKKDVTRSGRGRIDDVSYELIPTPKFSQEQKAANRRANDNMKAIGQ